MNAEAIQKLPTSIKNKINKRPTNTQFSSQKELDQMPDFTRIKYPYTKLPTNFDGRKAWPGINQNIFDQGECGSCWAFSTCSLLSDRYLILSKGKVNVTLSPTRLLLCDINGQDIQYAYKQISEEGTREAIKRIIDSRTQQNSACYGNTLVNAFQYLYIYGTCTTECIPYDYDYKKESSSLFSPVYANLPHKTKTHISIGKSDHNTFYDPISSLDYVKNTVTGLPPVNAPWTDYDLTKFDNNNYIPSCGSIMGGTGDMCINWNRGIIENMYLQGTPARFYRIGLWYMINYETLAETNEAIRQDIYKWGPIVSVIEIFEDFYEFDPVTTIYSWNGTGVVLSAHAIEIVGWGVDNNTKYWLVKNSWGKKWGDGGYFKIKRGVNECKIEDNAFGALPDFFASTIIDDPEPTRQWKATKSMARLPNSSKKTNKMGNIYGIELLQRNMNAKNKKWELTKVNPLKFSKNGSPAQLARTGLDISLFSGLDGLDVASSDGDHDISPYLDFVHNFTGGIDPYTGFTRRAMLMHPGLDFTAPITIHDINFTRSFYAGKQKIKRLIVYEPIFISNYIFYTTIFVFVLLIIFLVVKKFQ